MDDLLRRLLTQLDEIGQAHEELFDTECSDRMRAAVMAGYVRRSQDFTMPDEFGLHTAKANESVKSVLTEYIAAANQRASELGLSQFHERLAAFQNSSVESDAEGSFYDDFFGYSPPEAFDSSGKVLG